MFYPSGCEQTASAKKSGADHQFASIAESNLMNEAYSCKQCDETLFSGALMVESIVVRGLRSFADPLAIIAPVQPQA